MEEMKQSIECKFKDCPGEQSGLTNNFPYQRPYGVEPDFQVNFSLPKEENGTSFEINLAKGGGGGNGNLAFVGVKG